MRKHYIHQIGGISIKPLTLTRFWHRRICEAIMLIAAIILALYTWVRFNTGEVGSLLLVSDTVAIMAAGAFTAGLVSYFLASNKHSFIAAWMSFMLLAATVATLIMETGETSSPFIALWMAVGVFAGIFGMYGLLPLFIALAVMITYLFSIGNLTREAIVAIVLAGEIPLVISYLIWHTKTTTQGSDKERDGRNIADSTSELSQLANKAEVVINAIADGVIAINSKGAIQLINPAAQQMIGWGKQDALALDYKAILKLIDKNGAELTSANDPVVKALTTNEQITDNTLTLVTNSAKRILVAINVSPVGQPGSGVIVVFRDITKEKSEEREQAEFISTASHEMRTPVASIEGYLGLALNPATATIDIRARDFINKAHESAQHLGRLFQDLLDVTKADDGRLSNNPKVVDVVTFTHDIIQGLQARADAKGLRTMFKPMPDGETNERRLNPVYYANVDNDHLREVIGNLIENAIKYTPKGDITVDVTGDGDHVKISVADSGIGIPKEDQVHLFQKFYRVDNSETREIGGTGLGLYLCRRLTETMGGRLWVDSEYRRGSTFYVELPRIDHGLAMKMIEEASMRLEMQPAEQANGLNPFPTENNTNTPNWAADDANYTEPETPPYAATPPPTPAQSIPAVNRAYPQQAQPQQYATPQIPRPLSSQPQQNTPLSEIEKNPTQYVQPRQDSQTTPPSR